MASQDLDAAIQLAEEQGLFAAINAVRMSADPHEAAVRIQKSYGNIGFGVAYSLAGMASRAMAVGRGYKDQALNYVANEADIPVSGNVPEGAYHVLVNVEILPGGLGTPMWKSFTRDPNFVPTEEDILEWVDEEVNKWTNEYLFGIAPDILDVDVASIVKAG